MDVMFQSHPDVTIATNTFRNVPTILQYEDTPLIEVGKFEPAGYTTRFSVFHSDGTPIAVVKGSRIFLTDAGKKAQLEMRFEPNLQVCEFEGQPILELRRNGAAALKGWAELYAPEGVLIKAHDAAMSAIRNDGEYIQAGGMQISDSVFDGHNIGIHVTRTKLTIGGAGGKSMRGSIGNWNFHATGGGSLQIQNNSTDEESASDN